MSTSNILLNQALLTKCTETVSFNLLLHYINFAAWNVIIWNQPDPEAGEQLAGHFWWLSHKLQPLCQTRVDWLSGCCAPHAWGRRVQVFFVIVLLWTTFSSALIYSNIVVNMCVPYLFGVLVYVSIVGRNILIV